MSMGRVGQSDDFDYERQPSNCRKAIFESNFRWLGRMPPLGSNRWISSWSGIVGFLSVIQRVGPLKPLLWTYGRNNGVDEGM